MELAGLGARVPDEPHCHDVEPHVVRHIERDRHVRLEGEVQEPPPVPVDPDIEVDVRALRGGAGKALRQLARTSGPAEVCVYLDDLSDAGRAIKVYTEVVELGSKVLPGGIHEARSLAYIGQVGGRLIFHLG